MRIRVAENQAGEIVQSLYGVFVGEARRTNKRTVGTDKLTGWEVTEGTKRRRGGRDGRERGVTHDGDHLLDRVRRGERLLRLHLILEVLLLRHIVSD